MKPMAPSVVCVEYDKTASVTDIFWLGGASFLVVSHGTALLIDPVLFDDDTGMQRFAPPPISPEDIEPDCVLYTHSDSDHLGTVTAKHLQTPLFGGTLPCYEVLTRAGIVPERIMTYKDGKKFTVGSIEIEVFPADHPWQLINPQSAGEHFRDGECCGYILTTKDARMYFPGDTRLIKAHYGLSNIDFIALDISESEYHLGMRGAVILANLLPSAYLLPYHYGTYDTSAAVFNGDPGQLLGRVSNAEERILHYGIGERVRFYNGKKQ